MSSPSQKKTLIVIVGPTAIGKTRLSIQVAKQFKAEIISADSRQFFKEMSIGTAKPSITELAAVPHHFVDFISVRDDYSAGQFERDALAKINDLHKKHHVVVMVGGSGLYINAVCNGFDELPRSLEIRKVLMSRLETEGLEVLADELQNLDPDYHKQIEVQNTQRVIRGLEVCLVSGKTYTSFRAGKKVIRPFKMIKIGLKEERSLINERINLRVDKMIEDGLIDEVKNLSGYKSLNALKTVGYREIFEYLNGTCTLDEAVENIKKNTRNFAKRQMTWFKRDGEITWYNIGDQVNIKEDLKEAIHE
jgi:tRNA dimethylallyltransferase